VLIFVFSLHIGYNDLTLYQTTANRLGGSKLSGLLTVTEVADYLKTTTTTVYRWLREGKLTAVKIGKEWRFDEAQLNLQLNKKKNTAGTISYFWQSLQRSDHVLLITNKNSDITRFEASLFQRGLSEGATLMKGCWWQDEDEVVDQYARHGLDASSLIKDGILCVFNFSKLFEKEGIGGPVKAWRSSIENAVSRGAPRLWASGSPNMSCCGSDPSLVLAFEKNLNDALKDSPVIGFCPYSLEDESNNEHFDKIITLMGYHSGVAFYSDGQFSLLRQ